MTTRQERVIEILAPVPGSLAVPGGKVLLEWKQLAKAVSGNDLYVFLRRGGQDVGYLAKGMSHPGENSLSVSLPDLQGEYDLVASFVDPHLREERVGIRLTATDDVAADSKETWQVSAPRKPRHPSLLSVFDGIMCINLDSDTARWERMRQRFAALGLDGKVRRIPAVAVPGNYHIGCALSHRQAIQIAYDDGMENVLVFEDDAVFLRGAEWVLRRSLRGLIGRTWSVVYLGGYEKVRQPSVFTEGCTHLAEARGLLGTHAIAYHRRIYERLLTELPSDEVGMAEWIAKEIAIDQYYARQFTVDAYQTVPSVAAQELHLALEDPDLRDQFPIEPTT
ncbi:glycosyltransferase family 25 protein [Streptomyces coffeae]|uniref:Glycosyltransferase family 25 protein n=1 Tax=Streptomyces coffeae TaxID=621382 RepID=A0ABS1NSB0_9ACTN|nr:glycosyltransferase family 25 protein [Streptomyces coffeae]MBL1102715.1 glycosyltransferase family 25 protein [Streptomyces coffeae]